MEIIIYNDQGTENAAKNIITFSDLLAGDRGNIS
jgi:hypothetical protein